MLVHSARYQHAALLIALLPAGCGWINTQGLGASDSAAAATTAGSTDGEGTTGAVTSITGAPDTASTTTSDATTTSGEVTGGTTEVSTGSSEATTDVDTTTGEVTTSSTTTGGTTCLADTDVEPDQATLCEDVEIALTNPACPPLDPCTKARCRCWFSHANSWQDPACLDSIQTYWQCRRDVDPETCSFSCDGAAPFSNCPFLAEDCP